MHQVSTNNKVVNYLNYLPDPIKPMGSIGKSLRKPFFAFLLNDEYRKSNMCMKKKIVTLEHPIRNQVTITASGVLNVAGIKRYNVFLKLYYQRGSAFIHQLNSQIRVIPDA